MVAVDSDCPVQDPPIASLASVRKSKLLSQRALAHKAGVALSTIYMLEAGRTERTEAGRTERTTFKVIRAVSEALSVPPESIAEFRRVVASDGR